MKGLLFKEFYLTRKTYLGFLGVFLGMASLCILAALSMICGNLQEIMTESPEVVSEYFQMFVYAPFAVSVFSVAVGEDSVFKDYASGWMQYSYTSPVPAAKMVGVRFLAVVIIAVVSMVLGLGSAGIVSLILDEPITAGILKNMLVILMVAIGYSFLDIPLALRFKTAQAVQSKVGIAFIIIYIVAFGWFFKKTEQLKGEAYDQYMADMMEKTANIRDMLLPFAPIIMLALFAVSFTISIRLYQRREK